MSPVQAPAVTGSRDRAPTAGAPTDSRTGVRLRPLLPGETPAVERVFAGMSAQSRRMRFLAPVPRLRERMLHLLADVDHDRHGCWVAVAGGAPVGLGRYIQLPGTAGVAEVAFEVVDAAQGRGIGRLLAGAVAVAAADAGMRSLLWVLDPANTRVRRLIASFDGRLSYADGLLEARTDLPLAGRPIPGLDVAATVRLARAARRSAAVPAGREAA